MSTTYIYTLSLHDALPILSYQRSGSFLLRTTALGKRNYLETRERALPRHVSAGDNGRGLRVSRLRRRWLDGHLPDRKSTRLNSSHTVISYAVFCLKKKNAY